MKLKTLALVMIGSCALVLTSVAQNNVIPGIPPPPLVDTVGPAPGPGYVWVSGQWIWNGGWVWSSGYWAPGAYPSSVWVGTGWARGPSVYPGVVVRRWR